MCCTCVKGQNAWPLDSSLARYKLYRQQATENTANGQTSNTTERFEPGPMTRNFYRRYNGGHARDLI